MCACVHMCVYLSTRRCIYMCACVYEKNICMKIRKHTASDMCIKVWGGRHRKGEGRRREIRHKNYSDIDGTSTKYDAHWSTTSLMLTSSTTPQRDASEVWIWSSVRERMLSLIEQKVFNNSISGMHTDGGAQSHEHSHLLWHDADEPTGLHFSWSHLKLIHPTTGSCTMCFSLATAPQYVLAQKLSTWIWTIIALAFPPLVSLWGSVVELN